MKRIFYNKNVSCLPRPCSFFHCPWRVGMGLCFPRTRLELCQHQWVSVMSPLKPWVDFGYSWLLLVGKLFYPFPQWHLGNSWINMGCAYSKYHCDGKPGVMHYKRHVHLPDKGCLSWIIYEVSQHTSKFCKSNGVLVMWASSLQLPWWSCSEEDRRWGMEEEEEIGSKWRDRERLLFSCANDEVCRAMKCELVRSCCALEQKSV